MKLLFSILLGLWCVTGSAAFSSEAWLAERGDDSDVLRLRKAYSECMQLVESPAENILIPLESFPNGKVKSRITAARAHIFLDSSLIWGEKIRVEQYKEDGTLYASLDADNCLVDRKTKSGWVEGAAKMIYGDSMVKGRGIYFSLEREFVKIFSQTEIKIKSTGFNPQKITK